MLAVWIIRALPALLPPSAIPFGFTFQFDVRVMMVTLAIAAVTVFAFGLWPAIAGSRLAIAQAARSGSTPGRARTSARNVVVIAQIAIAFVLLVVDGLLARSAWSTAAIDPGVALQLRLPVTLSPATAVTMDRASTSTDLA